MISERNISEPTTRPVTLTVAAGVTVVVEQDSLVEHLQKRASQLSALNYLLTSGDFEGWDETIKADAKWLAATLAAEVSQLAASVTIGENLV